MYQNLIDLMKEKNVTQSDLAKYLNKRNATISDKIRGIFPFTLNEAKMIRDNFFPETDIDHLFDKTED